METITDKPMEVLILETAERLFLAKGFASVSTVQIARECGCNQALVHYYFRTKENLFNTIFESKFRLFFESIQLSQQEHNLNFIEKLTLIIEKHFDLLLENQQLPMLIFSELLRKTENIEILKNKLKNIPEKFLEVFNTELQNEIKKGNIREISILDLLISMISLNIALFVAMPILKLVLGMDENQKTALLMHRRKEHVSFVLNSIIIK
ncbi:MAG: TetR/AcrR family transcriptional regulator [Paludibacter sp.]